MNISCGNLPFRLHSNLLSAVKFKLVFSGCTVLMFWQQSTAVKVWRFRGVYQPQAGRTGAPAFGETKKESPVCVCVCICMSV